MTDDKRVVSGKDSDPEMQRAFASARETFRWFWQELSWEKRRIIPGLDFAYVKAAFSDGGEAEHMWMSDVEFDGQHVSGVLLNEPLHVQARKGDPARVLPSLISDWMFGSDGKVYGGYTVQALRARMGSAERREHDRAWGLNFGDPSRVKVFLEPRSGGVVRALFGKGRSASDEHPMSLNMAPSLREQIAQNPSMTTSKDARGWTLLHEEALAGSVATVKVLLEAGADRTAVTDHGMTPVQLARSLGWERVVALLDRRVEGCL
ncbi:MAG TPA: DUF2314 domain-containing protein [Myxococcaceae bacterium]|nr:DUF2314 domain-containing protein [Myxococcaceae bacterium]